MRRKKASKGPQTAPDAKFASQALKNGRGRGRLDLWGLLGAKIVNVGFHPSQKEGGLTIDYDRDGKGMRVVLGYNELGEWVVWQGERLAPKIEKSDWSWCPTCETWYVECKYCGNTSCNGGGCKKCDSLFEEAFRQKAAKRAPKD